MRPRLTPSTGISTLRASSAARRNVPSPPSTSTSSQPSAARSSASTTSISTPRCCTTVGAAGCNGCVVDCLGGQHAQPDAVVAEHLLHPTGGFGGLVTTGVDDEQDAGVRRSLWPLFDGSTHGAAPATSPSSGRSVCARRRRKYSTLPDGPGSGLDGDVDGVPVEFGGPARDRQHRVGPQLGIGRPHRPARRGPCRPRTVASPWERYRRPPTRRTPARAAPWPAR